MALEAIRYTPDSPPSLHILDQLQLPHATVYQAIENTSEAWTAIREMRTRGAPAIAIVAVLSLHIELVRNCTDNISATAFSDARQAAQYIREKLDYLVTSRPTAVNLEDAARKLARVVEDEAGREGVGGEDVVRAYSAHAVKMLKDDVADNQAIGKNGAEWIMKNVPRAGNRGANIVTICNTG